MTAPTFVRRAGALLTAAVGLMNILSALYPAVPARVELLRDLLPMHLIRASQTATVLVGFCLILLADALRKRRRRAMQITIVLLVASAALNITKGLDFEEASVALFAAGCLFFTRAAYTVVSAVPAPRQVLRRIVTFGLLYYCYVLAGFLLLRHAVLPTPTAASAFLEPIRFLILSPHFRYLTPQSRWFGRSLIALGSLGTLYTIAQVLRPLMPSRAPTEGEREHVRRLVRRYGSDTLSYFTLQDGRSYFFDDSGEAVLSYRLWGNVALVGGDPVGRPDRIAPLIVDFLDFAHETGIEPCFLGVSHRHMELYRSAGMRFLKIGEEALIDLPSFNVAALKRKVRRAARHVEDAGIVLSAYRAPDIPGSVRGQLEAISARWVEAKGGVEQGFSMTLGRLPRSEDEDCEVFVASLGNDVLGYLSFVPAYDSATWSLDSMRRRPDSPNGLTEFLVIHAAEQFRDRGFQRMSLNFATLSNSEDDIDSRALDGARRFLWEQLSGVYQLKSLYQFNNKFGPIWRSRYLAYGDVLKIPKLAVAIAQSEAPIQLSPVARFRRSA